ncbi:TetR family transcriptional regulator [Emticicia sp. CRIBPO]|uniref:TetR/AcrR family transcriptional regulator n=1 Tax=Emticicia sp. CRIBPO TaxID=2683258 RepID=UPI001412A7ED|nr:TetR/AcrR family transcriptional regulator [Emticicia sp. CRIBPO]NBA85460.1 TetR family transcriptional regulator [Emticicia sp. CRIBPO]
MSKAERTRSFIIERTSSLFNTKGFAGTSMNDITEATGLTKGSVYGNFKNKDEVALAVFENNSTKMQKLIAAEISKKKSYREKLLAYPEMYESNYLGGALDGGCPILNTAIEADDTHSELKEAASQAFTDWKDKIAALVKAGIENKEFKSTTQPEETAINILASIEGMVMISRLTGKLNYRRYVLDALRKQIQEL